MASLNRPSLERTMKYIPVVPSAQTKLGREARRASHDLRRLIGHANLLDTLMDKLDLDTVDEQQVAEAEDFDGETPAGAKFIADESGNIRWNSIDFGNDDDWNFDSSSSSEDDEELITPEFDHENDDDHALSRTVSRKDIVPAMEPSVHAIPVVTPEAEHPIAVTAHEIDEDEDAMEVRELDRHIQMSGFEFREPIEDYFSDKDISHQRAQVAASLATFDIGTAWSATNAHA